jgi:putative peptidoglycan lipid II flippase
VRVALTIGLGYLAALPLPRLLGIDPRWGAAGLTASAGMAGWVEFVLLRAALNRRIGATGLPVALAARRWAAAAAGAGAAWGLRMVVPVGGPILTALLLLTVYGGVYFFLTDRLGVPEAAAVTRRLRMREPRGGPAG